MSTVCLPVLPNFHLVGLAQVKYVEVYVHIAVFWKRYHLIELRRAFARASLRNCPLLLIQKFTRVRLFHRPSRPQFKTCTLTSLVSSHSQAQNPLQGLDTPDVAAPQLTAIVLLAFSVPLCSSQCLPGWTYYQDAAVSEMHDSCLAAFSSPPTAQYSSLGASCASYGGKFTDGIIFISK